MRMSAGGRLGGLCRTLVPHRALYGLPLLLCAYLLLGSFTLLKWPLDATHRFITPQVVRHRRVRTTETAAPETEPVSTERPDVVEPFQFWISPKQPCHRSEDESGSELDTVVYVASGLRGQDFVLRRFVRRTWAKDALDHGIRLEATVAILERHDATLCHTNNALTDLLILEQYTYLCRVYFFVGYPPLDEPERDRILTRLRDEHRMFGDIIQVNVMDRYTA